MYTPQSLPIRSDPQTNRPVKRYYTTKYYTDRVKESLTTRFSKFICTIVIGFIILCGIIAFILWLSLRPHRPRFFMHDFTIPGLGQPTGFENARVTFNITARNSNGHIGIFYDKMDGSVFYRDLRVGSISLLYPFYQEPKNTTVVYGDLVGASLTVNSNRWIEFSRDRGQGLVLFRVEIMTTIKFKVSTWLSKRHRMHVTCEARVGTDGTLAGPRDLKCPVYFT